MSSHKNRKAFLLVLVIGVVLNFALTMLYYQKKLHDDKEKEFVQAAKMLEVMHANFSVTNALQKKINDFLHEFVELDTKSGKKFLARWLVTNSIPASAISLVIFANDKVLNVPESERQDWQLLLQTIDRGYARRLRVEGENKNRLIKLLKGGVGYETIEARQGVLRLINRGPEKTYAAWIKKEDSRKKRAVILFINEGALPGNFLAKFLLENCKNEYGQFAFIDLFAVQDSIIPDSSVEVKQVLNQIKNSAAGNQIEKIKLGKRVAYLSAKPNGRVLLFLPWKSGTAFPAWMLAAMFFWIPALWRQMIMKPAASIFSLKNLLFILMLLGLILPATVTGVYWNSFITTKRQSLKIKYAKKIEEGLILLDAQHQTVVRKHKDRFSKFMQLLDGNLSNLQQFIDESVRMEIDMMIDSLLLIDKEGNFLRPYSSSLSTVRGLVLYPLPYRKNMVKQFMEMGWVPFDHEVNYIFNSKELDFNRHVDFKANQGQVIITSLGKMAGKDIISTYNEQKGFIKRDGRENMSAMVMGSFVENIDENPNSVIAQNLGDFVELGFGEYKSRNYVDVIKDEQGKAVYAAIIYSSANLTTLHFFLELFAFPRNWPDSIKYVAISQRPLRYNFPWPDTWKRMESLLRQLKPPRNLMIDEVTINGKPHLRCSYVAKNCSDFILSGYMPLAKIDEEINQLKHFLLAGGALLFLTLAFVFWRLNITVLRPAQILMKGVKAIAAKKHEHKINLATSDEWEKLGNTFNTAIEGLKELQMANFVQNCILPGAQIVSGKNSFLGKTVPAAEVGGDYYEALPAHEGMVFIMGDVSGHSVSAALVVSMADAAFSALLDQGCYLPHEILANMNILLLENLRRIKMMTCFCGYIDKQGTLSYANAGQSFPLLITDTGVTTLKQVGYPLGVAKKKKFKSATCKLPQRCRLLMYSDGVIEAQNESGEVFGYERLEALAGRLGCRPDANHFIDQFYAELKDFCGSVPWNDDVTLVVVDRN